MLDTSLFSENNLDGVGSVLLTIGANVSAGAPVAVSLSSWWTDLFLNVEENNMSFSKGEFIHYGYENSFRFNPRQITVPISISSEILPKKEDRRDKVIFIDELHEEVIKRLADKSNVYSVLFTHCLDVCNELRKFGFKFITFSRNIVDENLQKEYAERNYIELISKDRWIPYGEMLRYYSMGSMFFNFVPETFGFPIYENMQMDTSKNLPIPEKL